MRALLTFLPLFHKRLGAWGLTLLLSLVALGAGIALLGTSGWFITATALTTLGLGFNIFVPSASVRAFSFIRILARYGERLVGHDATLKLLSDLRGWLFGALFPRLPLKDRSLRHGDLVGRLTADIDALDTSFLVAIGPLFSAVIVGGIVTAVLAVLLPGAALPYGGAMLVATLVVPIALVTAGRASARQSVAAMADMRLAVFDGVAGHVDLNVLGALGQADLSFGNAAQTAAGLRTRLSAYAAVAGFTVQALAAIALVATLWIGLTAMEAGHIDGPAVAGLLLAVLGSFEATAVIVRSVGKAAAALAAAERLDHITSLPTPILSPDAIGTVPSDADIVLKDVTFSYDGPAVLTDVNLTVHPGEQVALVGPSGSGKSTLLHLLLGLVEPDTGAIALAGLPLSAYRPESLHAHMSILSQSSPIFIDSVRDNLLIARPGSDDAALWAVLEKAQLAAFIRSLPRGLDTVLGEAGRTLSAGQARRLCLARALLSDAPVILLDEPTDALDRDTELAFFETLTLAASSRTIIMATHADVPPGTVDRVLTLNAGVLSEEPTLSAMDA
ncbi:MAG: thiol reductant ABC exporter subunit CydC [Devosia sp.]|uniref:thiol reductant ABC exporter subunit CydC n=1 Tax=Devosia sp. TaxID=1871048 RepID=UPI0024C7DDC5|nr:thiol reductant ABC exporter subunit CydC [Devosia sp.]UYN99626.1 MAG: thiol reductant ABC exporter subunit CydC [Devosia sp.]